ncbi:MAG TPA: BtpA/SgcQ family protein [Longimicrobiales bacterium]|nr:BtpA/SgcQ family protein [Longimicrobiales bacterium]
MVHLMPLPGAPRFGGDLDAVLRRATADARALEEGGVDAVLVENFGDVPFHPGALPPETIAALTRAVATVRAVVALPVGVNALRNDAAGALAVCAATGASFIRVNVHTGSMYTDQGRIDGVAHRTLRDRERLAPYAAILADVLVKHAAPPPGLSLREAARDAWERGLADALIVSGSGTGEAASVEDVRQVAGAVPAPVYVGSGVSADTVGALLAEASGVIVGSALERNGVAGEPVEAARVARLVEAARA